MQQGWRARWWENGREREFLFDSIDDRVVARIDFLLCCVNPANGLTIPKAFELEEVFYGASDGIRWSRGDRALHRFARGE